MGLLTVCKCIHSKLGQHIGMQLHSIGPIYYYTNRLGTHPGWVPSLGGASGVGNDTRWLKSTPVHRTKLRLTSALLVLPAMSTGNLLAPVGPPHGELACVRSAASMQRAPTVESSVTTSALHSKCEFCIARCSSSVLMSPATCSASNLAHVARSVVHGNALHSERIS